jgi:hypothetical protein
MSSLQDFQQLVRHEIEQLRTTQFDLLKISLREKDPSKDPRYWENAAVMVCWDWDNNSDDVRLVVEKAKRDYARELDATLALPPSAQYILAHPDGRNVVGSIGTPLEIIQNHITMVSEKRWVLNAVNAFFVRLSGHEPEADNKQRPLSLSEKLEELSRPLAEVQSKIIEANNKLETAKKHRTDNADAWSFLSIDNLPQPWREHLAVEQMKALIIKERDERRWREQALEVFTGLAKASLIFDDATALRNAISNLELLMQEYEKDDPYGVLREARNRTYHVPWTDNIYQVNPRQELENFLGAMNSALDEQNQLKAFLDICRVYSSKQAGLKLSEDSWWENVRGKDDLWRKAVQHAPMTKTKVGSSEKKLRQEFGSYDLYIHEENRWNAKFAYKDFEQAFIQPVRRTIETGALIYPEEPEKWQTPALMNWTYEYDQLIRRESWFSLGQTEKILEHYLAPVGQFVPSQPISDSLQTWPPLVQRLTLSRAALNLLVEMRILRERLTILTEFVSDYERNAEAWRTRLEQLVRPGGLIWSTNGDQKSRHIRLLRDLAPAWPEWPADGYSPKVPPLLT